MQFRVPQNIDLEDKIVGPLTMKQFLYLLVGGMIDYVLFQALVGPENPRMGLFLLVGVPVGLLAVALAFLKIQDRPFGEFLVSLVVYIIRPRQRVWHRETSGSQSVIRDSAIPKKTEEKTPTKKHLSQEELANLSNVLDTGSKDEINKAGN